jgi:hypothetical protein
VRAGSRERRAAVGAGTADAGVGYDAARTAGADTAAGLTGGAAAGGEQGVAGPGEATAGWSDWRGRHGTQAVEAGLWLAVVAWGFAVAGVLVASDVDLGTAAAPFAGHYRHRVVAASLLAPGVAAGVLAAVHAGILARLRWRALLACSYVATLAWALALALVDGRAGLTRPLRAPGGSLGDVPAVGDDPLGFIRTFTDRVAGYSPATRAHPPGQVLALWSLERLGLRDPFALGLAVTAIGCLTVPLVVIAVRSLCHEPAARRLVPVLALAPWAVWTALAPDALTATLAAAGVTIGVVGSEPGRRPRWAAASGLALGMAALCGYGVAWLGIAVVATNFVRRRPFLNVVTGAAGLLPLWVFFAWGFSWPEGLAAAGADVTGRGGGSRAWLAWAPLDVALLAVACGPVLVRAARRWRMTPGWPFLAGAVPAIALGVLTGLSRGEVERSWLPFFPWLLVAALAPRPRPPGPGDRTTAGDLPTGLVAIGAATAVLLAALLASPW